MSDQLKGDLVRLGKETGPVNICCGLFADQTAGIVTTIKHSGLIERGIREKNLMDIYSNQVALRYSHEMKVPNRRVSMTCYDFRKCLSFCYGLLTPPRGRSHKFAVGFGLGTYCLRKMLVINPNTSRRRLISDSTSRQSSRSSISAWIAGGSTADQGDLLVVLERHVERRR